MAEPIQDPVAAMERWLDQSGEFDSPGETQEPARDLPLRKAPPPVEDDAGEPNEELEAEADAEAEGDPGDESADSADDAGDEGEYEGEEVSTLEAIAEAFEVEPAQVLENVEVDGPDGSKVSLREALDGWRSSESRVVEREEQLEAEFRQAREKYDREATESVMKLGSMLKLANGLLESMLSKDRVEDLRHSDPDAYLEAMQMRQKVMQVLDGGLNLIELEGNRQQQSSMAEMQDLIRQEQRRLFAAKPHWRDDKAREEAQAKHARYLKSLPVPFTDQEINGIMDHRMLLVVDDAVAGAALREGAGSKKLDTLKKRGLKRPTPGFRSQARRDPENPRNRARESARARLRKTGDARAAAALIEDLI